MRRRPFPSLWSGVGADPVKTGLVESLARPGGNITGIIILERHLGVKRLVLLKESVPKLARVAVLCDPDVPAARQVTDDLPIVGHASGLTIQPLKVRASHDLKGSLPRCRMRALKDSTCPQRWL